MFLLPFLYEDIYSCVFNISHSSVSISSHLILHAFLLVLISSYPLCNKCIYSVPLSLFSTFFNTTLRILNLSLISTLSSSNILLFIFSLSIKVIPSKINLIIVVLVSPSISTFSIIFVF